MPENETFQERLQRLRNQRGFTLEALAEKVGSTKSYLWELENKPTIRPSAVLVYNLAVALDTTVGVLMGETNVKDIAERDQVFFRNYTKLNPETRKRLSKIMDVLMEGDDEDDDL